MNEEEEKTRRTDITAAMHLIPLNVDFNEGCAMLRTLYDIGWLGVYLRESQIRNRKQDPESRTETLHCECSQYGFTFESHVKTDSFGRITSLFVPPTAIWNDEDDENWDEFEFASYDLPPSISLLRHLQYIFIDSCQRIPLELGDLPCLTEIDFGEHCDINLFDRIPDGLQLPVAKRVSGRCPPVPLSISSFLSLLPDCLEELNFTYEERPNAIISALQNEELRFRQSLTKLDMSNNQVDNVGLESLLFKVVPRFPSLRDLRLRNNNITSFSGIEQHIQEADSIADTSLVSLDLGGNRKISREILRICEHPSFKKSSSEKSAALLLLKTFDTISNLGASLCEFYDPDIECALRTNLIKRPFTDEGIDGKWPSNPALWPLMLEKVYQKSWKVYYDGDENYTDSIYIEKGAYSEEKRKNKRCATELFHMVRNGPIFAADRLEISQETITMEDDTTTN